MTWQLTAEEIVKHWKIIQYGSLMVNGPEKPLEYSLNLLKNLLTAKTQCWFLMDENRQIKLMIITRILGDAGDTGRLWVNLLYGFTVTTEKEHKEWLNTLIKFARNIGLESVVGYTSNMKIKYLAERMGYLKLYDGFEIRVGGKQ